MIRTEVIFECLNWLKKSKEDIISAEVLLDVENERKKYILASAGFHCQQSIEKSLKSFLILQQVNFRRTHDIDYLLNKCLEKSDLLSNINIII